ncbi:MAG: peptidoglycan DD-metalloendopeptidase family protein [Bacteroidales bacterium]|nr:peptidoglycan DD-metalloendopeptidase family protein [Bacteroidales bacterium]
MRFLLLSIFILFSAHSFSQSIESLRDEKQRLQNEIESSNKKLEEYAKQKDTHLSQIAIIDDKILTHKRLITIYKNEMTSFNSQLKILTNQLDSLELSLNKSRDEYANLIRNFQYSSLNTNSIIYLLSASTFNESYRRLLFIRQYKDYHKDHYRILEKERSKYLSLKANIDAKRKDLNVTLSSLENENEKLQGEISRRNKVISSIAQNQSQLQQQIAQNIKQSQELESRILQLIEEEKRLALASHNSDNSQNIEANKGKLLWPVTDFVLASSFGQHEHPLYPSIIVNNNGIDINLLSSTDVRPVASGVVSRVIVIPGNNASIIVKHGTSLSVYSNISEVSVKKDDVVTTSTLLGKVFTGSGLNSRVLHFELWVGGEKQNPEEWLVAR